MRISTISLLNPPVRHRSRIISNGTRLHKNSTNTSINVFHPFRKFLLLVLLPSYRCSCMYCLSPAGSRSRLDVDTHQRTARPVREAPVSESSITRPEQPMQAQIPEQKPVLSPNTAAFLKSCSRFLSAKGLRQGPFRGRDRLSP
jgi:hypothetical protein